MSRPLRVLQVNTSDAGGGAEQVTMNLHAAYMERGLDAWVAVGDRRSDDARVLAIDNDAHRSAWTRAVGSLGKRLGSSLLGRAALVASDPVRYARILAGREDYAFPASADVLELPPSRPDVVQLHNLHGYYFDLRRLPSITSRAPGVITMHDAWLVTGHCAHPFDCPNWREGCGDCPDLGMYVPIARDASAANRRERFDILSRSDVRLATPSDWLMRLVNESGAAELVSETRVIPNGIDTAAFAPADRAKARASLGMPSDRPIVLVVANVLKVNPFKDYATLIAALPLLAERTPNALVIAIGAGEDALPDVGLEVRGTGFVERTQLPEYFGAADVYVHPARAENLPLAVIEATACGTPVVASDVGGVGEIVVDGVTGDLVPAGDPRALAEAIASLLADGARRESYAAAGRQRALARFTIAEQADAYAAWFEEIVSSRPGRSRPEA